jgi:energy-coupling factor transporter ATP-binding protein EcfA2
VRLLRLRIERFRGIRSLDAALTDRLACLVGPGDVGKSTVLDAIARLASPGNVTFSERDFFSCDPGAGLVIEGTFGDLPVGCGLLAESRFGLFLGGVDTNGDLHDEPGDHEPTITVRLEVDQSLEPAWRVVTAADPDGRPIGARDRALLGVAQVGVDPDRQFTWARSSALARITGEGLDGILVAARQAFTTVATGIDLQLLETAVASARAAGVRLGAGPLSDSRARIDIPRLTSALLALHTEGVPVAAAGLGSRRLLALGIELAGTATGGVVCLDELESGLEPHRVRHLIRALIAAAESEQGQVLFTSHSPTVIEELGARYLHTVRNTGGEVTITAVPGELTPVVRANATALLSKSVIVAEGKTEIGLLRAYARPWAAAHDGRTLAFEGTVVVDGGGASAPERAQRLHRLGYPTLLFADSDRPLSPAPGQLRASGVEVVQWPGSMCTEQRLLTDLSWPAVEELFSRLPEVGLEPRQCIDAVLATPPAQQRLAELTPRPATASASLDELVTAGFGQALVRECLWRAATPRNSRGWFKLIDTAQVLGEVAIGDDGLAATPAGQTLARIQQWAYGAD